MELRAAACPGCSQPCEVVEGALVPVGSRVRSSPQKAVGKPHLQPPDLVTAQRDVSHFWGASCILTE